MNPDAGTPHGAEREETLDPGSREEWEALRELGYRMVDRVLELHRDIRDRPAWRRMTTEAESGLTGALSPDGSAVEDALRHFDEAILPFNLGTIHPRFWGWVNGSGTTVGAFAEMLAAGMNPNCAGHLQSAYNVEAQVLETLRAAIGLPDGTTGALTSGASIANFIGLACARDWACRQDDVSSIGLRDVPRQLVAYTCETAHNSVDRAIQLLGIGREHLRRIPATSEWRMDVAALAATVTRDREAGLRPFCVVGTAGTVDQGAIDPLAELAGFCDAQDLWFHVDGAYGAIASLSVELRELVAGIERAHSLAFDLHKWLHVPIEAGCVFVRNRTDHQRPFLAPAAYLRPARGGIAPEGMRMANFGPELTRGFRALKAWFTLSVYGTDKLGRLAAQNVRQVRGLEAIVREHPRLEALASGPLNTLCFRYVPPADAPMAGTELDELNEDILVELHESGRFAPSSTWVGDRFAIRLTVTNHRTRMTDLDELARAVVELGDERLAAGTTGSPGAHPS